MFKYTSLKEQVMEERRINAALKALSDKNTSNIDYIAMMTDIELDTDNDETEDDENNEQ